MRQRRSIAAAAALLLGVVGLAPAALAETGGPAALTGVMPRSALAGQSIYFVMTDRYANGDPTNDDGGQGPDGGLRRNDPGYFHGGDLLGLTQQLPRIADMGFTAVWITPPFVQQSVQGGSAAYHGYWIRDFTTIDPHFGTEEQFAAFVDAAHQRGLAVYVDIVMNHTADINRYTDGDAFSAKGPKPAYVPTGAPTRAPAFLNDLANYHNQGNIGSWTDDVQARNGDFFGLDDIRTESSVVVDGFAQVYADFLKKYEVDGFRIDTARHVDAAFFTRWVPALLDRLGAAAPRPALFGEALLTSATALSPFIREAGLPSVLDFPLQDTLVDFARGSVPASSLVKVLAADDFYNGGVDAYGYVHNVYEMPVFGGNHDIGRLAFHLRAGSRSAAQDLQRVKFALSLLYLLRGVPVMYYGDELGLIGDGGDKAARQDLFPTEVLAWQKAPRVAAAPIGKGSLLATPIAQAPLAVHVKRLNTLRKQESALRQGALQPLLAKGSVLAWSRTDAGDRREFLVLANAGDGKATVTVPVATNGSRFAGVFGTSATFTAAAKGTLKVTVPARTVWVLRADSLLPRTTPPALGLTVTSDVLLERRVLTAVGAVGRQSLTVTFATRACDVCEWRVVARDDAAPYRVVLPADQAAAQFVAVASNGADVSVGPVLTL